MRKFPKILGPFLSVMMLLSIFPASAQYNPAHFYYRGRQALEEGKYAAAIEGFNVLSRIDTISCEAWFFRGIAKYNLGDFSGAESDFSTTLRKNPLYTPAYHYRAITRSRTGRYEEALEDLREAVDLRPGYTGLYFSRGVTYFLSQQFDKAVEDFDKFIKREPKEGNAYLNRGASYLFLGDTTKALADYNKAISLNRSDPEGYIRRSRIYAARNNFEEAIGDLNTAIHLDTANSYAYFNRALLRYDNKDLNGALDDLNKVLDQDPGNALTLYNRALILSQVGQYPDALDDYDRVININPENVLAYFNRASVFMEMSRWREAIADYSRAIDLYPDFAKAYMNRSIAENMLGNMKQSKEDYQTAQRKIREYDAATATSGKDIFADTTNKYSHLLALDAEFAKKDFDNELLQYRDVNIRLKPLFKFSIKPKSEAYAENVSMIGRRLVLENFDNFVAASPILLDFSAKEAQAGRGYGAGAETSAALGKSRSAENLFARALHETELRQFNTALTLYGEAAAKEPENPFILLNRGVLQAEMTDFIASMENNVQVLTMDNTNTAKTRLAEQNATRYDYSAALKDMQEAERLDPDFPYTHYNLGNLQCLSDNLPESVNEYTKALELYPYIAEAYFNRGLVLIFMKDKEKGCLDISKAGELGIQDAYSVIKKYCTEERRD